MNTKNAKDQDLTKSPIQFQLKSQEVPRDFRTEIPNIVMEMLTHGAISPSAFILYSVYRRIAGQNGECWVGYRKLLEMCKMSGQTFRNARANLLQPFPQLNGKSLIDLEPGNKKLETADTVTIQDIWPENFHFFKNKLTWVDLDCTPASVQTAPLRKFRLQKKEPIKKEPNKKEQSSSSRASSSKPESEKCYRNDDASGGDDSRETEKIPISSLAAESGEVTVTKTNGTRLTMDQSVIYRHFLGKPYKTDTLREAIKRLQTVDGPVNNILKYLETTCKQIEAQPVTKSKPHKASKTSTENSNDRYALPEPPKESPYAGTTNFGEFMKREKMEEENGKRP